MIGDTNDSDIMIVKKLCTSPPFTNQRSTLEFTIVGTIAVLMNLAKTIFEAIDKLYSVQHSFLSNDDRCFMTYLMSQLMIIMTNAHRNERALIPATF